MEHFNIKITGKVQGVFFRASTQQKATELGLTGWIRNEPDGNSVYIEVEGELEKLNELVSWCHTGPAGAEVQEVKVSNSQPLKHFRTFDVKR